ncbi:MAG: hypothetical protein RJA22_3335, partial [Verrucomicrobiota bacterium]
MDTPSTAPPSSPTVRNVRRPLSRASTLVLALATVAMPRPAASAAANPALPPPAQRTVDFARDIQPILARHCYACHGPKRAEAALRLDAKADAFRGGDDYGDKILVPGRSAESILVAAVARTHPKLQMPKKGDALDAEAVGLIRAWIDHSPKVRPGQPRPANPIDAFILERLEQENLALSPEADRITLL